jgi:hypothetical protein
MRQIVLPCIVAASLLLAGCSDEAKILGKYSDPKGSTVEFFKDGTAVFTIGSQQAVWKWNMPGGDRPKFEPTAGVWGATAAVCDYALRDDKLIVTGCEYAMRLTRI